MVKISLSKKPKGVRLLEGFPGFGLIGTIVTEYLLEHLDFEKIGRIEMSGMPAMIAIHNGEIIEPISLHYNKRYNLVVVHALNVAAGMEWKLADAILEVAKLCSAKEVISFEGVGGPGGEGHVYFSAQGLSKANLKKLGRDVKELKEGVIGGVTGALLAKGTKIPQLALFAEAQGSKPDSEAAAKIIMALDDYAGLDVDPNGLRQQARVFEDKLHGLVQKKEKARQTHEKKSHLSYVG